MRVVGGDWCSGVKGGRYSMRADAWHNGWVVCSDWHAGHAANDIRRVRMRGATLSVWSCIAIRARFEMRDATMRDACQGE